ncbi:MAG TPA: site-specific integrase [Bryobacteraceae bacterium]
MAVYRPKRNGEVSKFFVCEFVYQGKRFQESTGATSKTVAKEYEKRRKAELERAAAGLPTEQKANRIRTVAEVVEAYLAGYKLTHRPSSIDFATVRLGAIERLLGTTVLSDLTEERMREYVRQRKADGASGRTINMELGELSRAIGRTWRELWPRVKKLEERKDVGRAISPEEQGKLLDAAATLRSRVVRTAVPLLMLTGLRSGEALGLRWSQVNLFDLVITVGRAKTSSGTGRQIPINNELADVLAGHRGWFVERFGEPRPEHRVFPFGSPQPTDPDRPVTDISSGWDLARKLAGVSCRLHDLRHTFCTRLAEAGVPESTMLALMGHMSRAMLERYSHIRMAAKRAAVAAITLRPKAANSEGVPVKVPVAAESSAIQ